MYEELIDGAQPDPREYNDDAMNMIHLNVSKVGGVRLAQAIRNLCGDIRLAMIVRDRGQDHDRGIRPPRPQHTQQLLDCGTRFPKLQIVEIPPDPFIQFACRAVLSSRNVYLGLNISFNLQVLSFSPPEGIIRPLGVVLTELYLIDVRRDGGLYLADLVRTDGILQNSTPAFHWSILFSGKTVEE